MRRRTEARPDGDARRRLGRRPLAAAALALARRFAAGATMWCVAPQWPSHGRHVAVEFVHPVIVGKRALPAVSSRGPDLVERLAPAGPTRATSFWSWARPTDPDRSGSPCAAPRLGA